MHSGKCGHLDISQTYLPFSYCWSHDDRGEADEIDFNTSVEYLTYILLSCPCSGIQELNVCNKLDFVNQEEWTREVAGVLITVLTYGPKNDFDVKIFDDIFVDDMHAGAMVEQILAIQGQYIDYTVQRV